MVALDDADVEDIEESFYKVKQGEDLERYDDIEKDLRHALAILRVDENSMNSIVRGAVAITRLKLFLYKYEGIKSDKAKICADILVSYKENPIYFLNALMEKVPRMLRLEYGLGLKKKFRKPWQQGSAKTNVSGLDLSKEDIDLGEDEQEV